MPKGKKPLFIQLDTSFILGDQFRKLEHIDVRIIIILMTRYNGYNNGQISLGLNDIVKECKCAKMTASDAMKRLQDTKLIERTYLGHTILGKASVSSKWRLLWIKDEQSKREQGYGQRTGQQGTVEKPNKGTVREPNSRVRSENRFIDLDLYHEEENTHHSTHTPTRNIDG